MTQEILNSNYEIGTIATRKKSITNSQLSTIGECMTQVNEIHRYPQFHFSKE